MLREIPRTRQIAGEAPRKWYNAEELDLVVWFDPEGQPMEFQLAYDKHRDEHAVSWSNDRGYSHYRVEEGPRAGTPLLIPGGGFAAGRVTAAFSAQAGELPEPIWRFVLDRLRSYSGPLAAAPESEALRMQRALERMGFNAPEEGDSTASSPAAGD